MPQFAQLRLLDLSLSKISDAGLESIGQLSNLTSLKIDFDKGVTDVGLARLAPIDGLSFLSLIGTAASKTGVEGFQSLKPGLRVAPLRLPAAMHLWRPMAPDAELLAGSK